MVIDLMAFMCLNSRMALTNDDLKALKDLMEVTVDEVLENREVTTKSDLSHLPTKDEFYEETGKILKRLDDLEVEKDVLANRVAKHEDRIEKIETHLGLTSD